jgi:hypothetical protein
LPQMAKQTSTAEFNTWQRQPERKFYENWTRRYLTPPPHPALHRFCSVMKLLSQHYKQQVLARWVHWCEQQEGRHCARTTKWCLYFSFKSIHTEWNYERSHSIYKLRLSLFRGITRHRLADWLLTIPISPSAKTSRYKTLEDGTNTLSRNVCNNLLTFTA